ncbi:MAG: hypothetical protein LBP61_08840 [Desulfovibrio sp.]|jgi:hypothetical protein|nr:hypothetical protein [Desulfovibrio sp.]
MNISSLPLLLGLCSIALLPAAFPTRAGGAEAAPPAREDGWITIEPGSRPAYVGIHGGTAPISLLRASNGLLFAFTGQTGNDFLHILRGNATHAPGASPAMNDRSRITTPALAASPPETAAPGAAPSAPERNEAETREETAPSLQASPALLPDGPVLAEGKSRAAPEETPPPPGQNEPASLPPGAHISREPATLSPARPDSAADAAEELLPPQAAIPPAVEAILADVPAGGPSLVFASGGLAQVIVESQAFVPFGLPLPGEKADNEEKGLPAGTIPAFAPLKLRDYRPILRYTGGV